MAVAMGWVCCVTVRQKKTSNTIFDKCTALVESDHRNECDVDDGYYCDEQTPKVVVCC